MEGGVAEYSCGEQLAGDIDAQHQDIVVPGGLLGPLDGGLQPVDGKGPAVVAEQVRARPMRDHNAGHTGPRRAAPGPTPRSKVRLPMTAAPTLASSARRMATSIWLSGPLPAIQV